MAGQRELVTGILTLLASLGAVRAKPMFGRHGLFLDDAMFTLIPHKKELFLKAGEVN
jgi:TfoX/Sxy family transcriptional regulator of competence genes